MAQTDVSTDGGEQTETIALTVDPETVVRGLELNSMPGTDRRVVFGPTASGGRGTGVLRENEGTRRAGVWLRPREFLGDDAHFVGLDIGEAKRLAREQAEGVEGANPDEYAEHGAEEWRSQMRALLEDEIVIEARFPGETRTVYEIEYEGES